MLKDTRFAEYFEFIGDFSNHFGIFDSCGTSVPFASYSKDKGGVGLKAGGGCC